MQRVWISRPERVGSTTSVERMSESSASTRRVRCRSPISCRSGSGFSTARTPQGRQRCEPVRVLLSAARSVAAKGRSCGFGRPPRPPSPGCTLCRVLHQTSPRRWCEAGSTRRLELPSTRYFDLRPFDAGSSDVSFRHLHINSSPSHQSVSPRECSCQAACRSHARPLSGRDSVSRNEPSSATDRQRSSFRSVE